MSVAIKNVSREFNEVEKYLMTISPAIKSMKDVADGTSIPVNGYMLFDDVNDETGEASEIMSIIDNDKNVYCFQSSTFKNSLNDIAGIMRDKPFSIIKISGKTKNGRDYINCLLDIESIK